MSKRKLKQWEEQIIKNYIQNQIIFKIIYIIIYKFIYKIKIIYKISRGDFYRKKVSEESKIIPGENIMNFQYSNMKQKSIKALRRKKLSTRDIQYKDWTVM